MPEKRYKKRLRAGWTALLAIYIVVSVCRPEWAPRCLIRMATGFDCPACGAVRAVSCFVRGEWRTAVFLNPYLIVVAPYLLAVCYVSFVSCPGVRRLSGLLFDKRVVLFFGCTMLVWWIFRNTPLWHAVLERESLL